MRECREERSERKMAIRKEEEITVRHREQGVGRIELMRIERVKSQAKERARKKIGREDPRAFGKIIGTENLVRESEKIKTEGRQKEGRHFFPNKKKQRLDKKIAYDAERGTRHVQSRKKFPKRGGRSASGRKGMQRGSVRGGG